MKKSVLVLSIVVCLGLSTITAWGANVETSRFSPEINPTYVTADQISIGMAINDGVVTGQINIYLKANRKIDYAQITAYIKKNSGVTVKTFDTKVTPIASRISWKDSYTLPSKGTYYLDVTTKCYKDGRLIENIRKESSRKMY